MKFRYLFIILTLVGFKSNAQDFYLEYYTNAEDSIQPELYSVFNESINWLKAGEYFYPEGCNNCQSIVDSNIELEQRIKTLSKDFLSRLNNKEFLPMMCPEFTTVIKRNKEPRFYHCKIYRIDKNKLVPLFKIETTFAESRRNNYYQISDITISDFMDKENFILTTKYKNYQKGIKELNNFIYHPPPIKKLEKK